MFNQVITTTKNLIAQVAAARTLNHVPRVILGLSGGADSVFLFQVLKVLHHQGAIELFAAHLDHGWRTDSHKDVEFCKELCAQAEINFIAEHANNLDLTIKHNGSLEEVGRKLRRHFFETTLQQLNADFIALGHHQQDQQETFFLRMLRGSSLAGLRCMNAHEGNYLRPLLQINKHEIISYLDTHKIKFVHDPSNDSDDFLRNKIRKQIIPAFNQCDARFNQKFASTLLHLQEEDDLLQTITQETFNNVFGASANAETHSFHGSLAQFKVINQHLKRRVIIHWLIQEQVKFNVSSGFLNEILKFLMHPRGGSHHLSEQWTLLKKGDTFRIVKNPLTAPNLH